MDSETQEILELQKSIATFMRRLYTQKLTTTSGGNISALTRTGNILITPSASDKGTMQADEIGHMTMQGKILGTDFKPSIESQMHLMIYKTRPDVKAIVHAHPVTTSAFAASSAKISTHYIAESYAILGDIAYGDYRCMGSEELAKEVAEHSKTANSIVMRNHGALALGKNLLEAFDRLEVLENAAQITLINETALKHQAQKLEKQELKDIDEMMGRFTS